mmetsp:Transcript_75692/g.213953  ORF Transcript_75692/g.213953 Transcript_75692/m.213953 type:complete len:442 (+) Transcript_75692:740-2065(+)
MLQVTPSAFPRGMIVALCTGSAPLLPIATRVWPPSWYAVSFFSWSLMGLARSRPTTTRSKASSRYFIGTLARSLAEDRTAAMFRMLKRSAPVMPAVRRARVESSTSLPSMSFAAYSSRISLRPFRSGTGTTTCLSRRPGRVSALSRDSGKLVAHMTTMPLFCSNPSSSTSSWFKVILTALLSRLDRVEPTASISSMNTMHGACFRASWKRSRTLRAPTPTYISSKSDPEACRNGTPASPAIARARSVFPVPGTPDIITPLGSLAPRRVKRPGSFRYRMISSSSSLTSSQPFTSSNDVVTSSTGVTFFPLMPKPFCTFPARPSAKTDTPATIISIVRPERTNRRINHRLDSAICTLMGSVWGSFTSRPPPPTEPAASAAGWWACGVLDVATPQLLPRRWLRSTWSNRLVSTRARMYSRRTSLLEAAVRGSCLSKRRTDCCGS